MRAIQFKRYGGPEVLERVELPVPEPGPGEVRVKVTRSGVNFVDVYMRENRYFRDVKLPCVPGVEAVGTVDAPGPGVKRFKPGDRVALHHSRGTYAEYAVSEASHLLPIPSGITDDQAAVVPVQGLTAYHLLHTVHAVRKGETVLIHAAAGGVGLLAVQIAKEAGARVLATVSTTEKASLCREMGADEVILYTEKDFAGETKRLTDGTGADVVLDAVGRSTLLKSLEAASELGHVILYGWAGGKPEPLDPLRLLIGSKKLSGFAVRDANRDPVRRDKALAALFGSIQSGRLKLHVRSFPLEEAAQAQRELESRRTTGKLILIVGT